MKLCDELTVMVFHHSFVYISGLKLNALYTPAFPVSLLSINQLGHTGVLSTFM